MRHRWTTSHQSFVVCTQRGFWIPPSLPTSSNSLAARGVATMFNAPCGVRSSVSERKPSMCLGLFYVRKILNNDCVYLFKKSLFFCERLLPECGVVADHHLLSSCLSLRGLWRGRRKRTKCHNGNQSLSAASDGGKNTDRLISIHIGYILLHIWIFPPFVIEYFSFLKNGDSLQAEGEQLHPNQTAERTSAHWHYSHTFLERFFSISTALHCSLRVRRRLVAFFPAQRGKRIRVVGLPTEVLWGRNSPWTLLELTVLILIVRFYFFSGLSQQFPLVSLFLVFYVLSSVV